MLIGGMSGAETELVPAAQIPIHNVPLANGGFTSGFGGSQPIDLGMPALGISVIIATEGTPEDLGEIRLFAGNYAPEGWALCLGQELPVDGNNAVVQRNWLAIWRRRCYNL